MHLDRQEKRALHESDVLSDVAHYREQRTAQAQCAGATALQADENSRSMMRIYVQALDAA